MDSASWAHCPYCCRSLYPSSARQTVDGWACSNRIGCKRRSDSAALHAEIDWLRSFGWPVERVAQRLNVTTSCVEKYLAGQRTGAAA